MLTAWIVVREEKHVDPKFWVCLEKEDALKIANDVHNYWQEEYGFTYDDCEEIETEDGIFLRWYDDSFSVYVEEIKVREPGEIEPDPTVR
jgi:hypothetical protein